MDIYDCSCNNFISHKEISANFHSYQYFHNGKQIYPQNQAQLLSLVSKQSQKYLLIVTKISPKQDQKQQIKQALSHHELTNHLTQVQLQMINAHPQSLFQHKLFNFKYAMEKEGIEVSKEREEQLRSQLMEGSNGWKQANLEQLQIISKKCDKIIQKCLQ